MAYGPNNYYQINAVYPRSGIRQPYPRKPKHNPILGLSTTYNDTATSGAVCGGTATVSVTRNVIASGGATAGITYSMRCKLDEGTGTTVADIGSDLTGTFNGSPQWSTDVAPIVNSNPYSLLFESSNPDYVTLDASKINQQLTSISVSCWFKMASGLPTDASAVLVQSSGCFLAIMETGGLYIPLAAIYGNTNSLVTLPLGSPLSVGVWYHLALTWDGSTFKIFLNGVYTDSTPLVDTLVYIPQRYMGADGDLTAPFDGYIDDVRVYDYGISDKEVYRLAAGEDDRSASWASVYQPSPSSGSIVGGASGNQYNANVTASGGVLGGSSASVSFVANITTSGGANCGGSATVSLVNVKTTSGGVLCGGSATINTVLNISGLGGELAGSSATVTYKANISGLGGCLAGGTASSTNTNDLFGTGGGLVGGSATISFVDYISTSNGALVSGSATARLTLNITSSGGGLVGGTASFSHIKPVTSSGGSLVGGTSAYNAVFNITATGGMIVISASNEPDLWYEVGTGGVVVGGISYVRGAFNGVLCGSGSTNTETSFNRATGGSRAGGSATVSLVRPTITASGGVVAGGSSSLTSNWHIGGVGGGLAGGAILTSYNVNTSGGSLVAGSATVSVLHQPSISGGCRGGSTASVRETCNITGSGGVRAGGLSTNYRLYVVTVSGGSLAKGSGAVGISQIISGGVVANGQNTNHVSWHITGSGGAIASGLSINTANLQEHAQGGCIGNGKASVNGKRSFGRNIGGIGNSMSSANIINHLVSYADMVAPSKDAPTLPYTNPIKSIYCLADPNLTCKDNLLPVVVKNRQGDYIPPDGTQEEIAREQAEVEVG